MFINFLVWWSRVDRVNAFVFILLSWLNFLFCSDLQSTLNFCCFVDINSAFLIILWDLWKNNNFVVPIIKNLCVATTSIDELLCLLNVAGIMFLVLFDILVLVWEKIWFFVWLWYLELENSLLFVYLSFWQAKIGVKSCKYLQ